MLSVEKLTKYYGDMKALDEISFTVDKEKIVGLLGPNGAGKTTTIRILIGILPRTSGKIYLEGKELNPSSEEWKSTFGVVPEISNAYLDYNPLKNLLFSGGLYGLSKKRRKSRALKLLKEFGLLKRKDIKTKKISKGEKQRLNLCMALMHDPKFLFLDEPTTGLDVHSAQQLREKILNFKQGGKTILLTTHNLIEANLLCDEIIILNEGKIITIGSPDALRKKFAPASKIEIKLDKPLKDSESKKLNKLGMNYEISDSNKQLNLLTTEPVDDFLQIIELISDIKTHISNFKVTPASLEEIFLKIIGER
ncbi:MAG: ATP-binding cassette domain-containing protein [Candidatus Lokiarchaeota archaeon]|nr:ATP-binding cassette domain-containing protein [Candidatus Lokiarchaeota archaeon]